MMLGYRFAGQCSRYCLSIFSGLKEQEHGWNNKGRGRIWRKFIVQLLFDKLRKISSRPWRILQALVALEKGCCSVYPFGGVFKKPRHID